ncbi:MAG: hydrogenase maturation protease [Candidatus Competibacteraceae bacterium]|nr:hydrogenase maturation protease [Candidatus Competibacteraceae bacterium]
MRDTLIIGVGNALRGDDGCGPVVIQRLTGRIPETVTLLEHGGDGISLLQAWEGADWVILVDAAYSGATPGTIYRFDVAETELPRGFFHASTHELGVAEAVELARSLGRLPEGLMVYAIEGECFSAGAELSPAVADAVESVAGRIVAELNCVHTA